MSAPLCPPGECGWPRPLSSEKSARKAAAAFKDITGHEPQAFFGDEPWNDILKAFPDLDVMAVATPDHLHTQPILAALARGVHARWPIATLTELQRFVEGFTPADSGA